MRILDREEINNIRVTFFERSLILSADKISDITRFEISIRTWPNFIEEIWNEVYENTSSNL